MLPPDSSQARPTSRGKCRKPPSAGAPGHCAPTAAGVSVGRAGPQQQQCQQPGQLEVSCMLWTSYLWRSKQRSLAHTICGTHPHRSLDSSRTGLSAPPCHTSPSAAPQPASLARAAFHQRPECGGWRHGTPGAGGTRWPGAAGHPGRQLPAAPAGCAPTSAPGNGGQGHRGM